MSTAALCLFWISAALCDRPVPARDAAEARCDGAD